MTIGQSPAIADWNRTLLFGLINYLKGVLLKVLYSTTTYLQVTTMHYDFHRYVHSFGGESCRKGTIIGIAVTSPVQLIYVLYTQTGPSHGAANPAAFHILGDGRHCGSIYIVK